jgi:hypothetical protein
MVAGGTFAATPSTSGRFIDAGHPVEQPSIVADRYARHFSLNDGLA